MKITPDFIREKRKECSLARVDIVDEIMEAYVNDLICNGSTIVRRQTIVVRGITTNDFMDELRERGFLTKEAAASEVGRYCTDGSIKVTVPKVTK